MRDGEEKVKSATAPESVSDAIQRDLAASALRKRAAGKVPNNQEIAALKAVERKEEERKRWEHYWDIPQRHWRKMSGDRQTKTINEQAERYGIPFGGAKIDLPAVVKALHDFLARNARRLSRVDDEDDTLLSGSSSPALEEYRRHRAKLAELDVQQRQGELLPREVIHEGLGRLAQVPHL